jgi:5-keto 4-deoxyuronate isomerase
VSPAGASIAATASAKFYITFTPANTTAQTGNVVFIHNASSSPDTVAVSGTGTLPGFALDRRTVPFGLVLLGQNRFDSVTVSDTGKAALVISSVVSSNGAFTVNPANATIQPAQSRKFYLTFTPANTNLQTGAVVFNHNAPARMTP